MTRPTAARSLLLAMLVSLLEFMGDYRPS